MKYKIAAPHPSGHFLVVELVVTAVDQPEMLFQLPAWRPGRYELGNFAKNIRQWYVVNENNEKLAFRKISKDCWKVNTEGVKEVHVHYSYYAAQPDGGSCWVDDDFIYINPIHCCLYVPERTRETCIVELQTPQSYQVATSLTSGTVAKEGLHGGNTSGSVEGSHANETNSIWRIFTASDYDELVDSPMLASATLQHHTYEAEKTIFHIWIQGQCTPDWTKIVHDFRRFSVEQIKMMGDFPVSSSSQPNDAFHFLVLALPYPFHHGVEHLRSTVLAMGPGHELMNGALYNDFTGVASHELFHVWNIKTIRPQEMMPYDYTRENYSRLGFVYEGVTTYYGDLFLARSGVYSIHQFLSEISERVQRHFHNCGSTNLSVADSSYDTWLDGYTPGVPFRKTSIYDEGCLIALMTDLIIRRKTNNEKSLDDVMRILYYDFGKRKVGYTEHDYISIIENLTNESISDFFIDYVYGMDDYEQYLNALLNHFGCAVHKTNSPNITEHHFGFKVLPSASGSTPKVALVALDSPAYMAGLGKDDEIIAVNETKVEDNLNDLLTFNLSAEAIHLRVITPMKKIKIITLNRGEGVFFSRYSIVKTEAPSTSQQKAFNDWMKRASRQAYSLMN